MLCPVMLLLGVGVGVGAGILISKPKIDEREKEIDQLVTQLQTAKVDSEAIIQKAEDEVARNKKELTRTKDMLLQTAAQLTNAKREIKTLKSRIPSPPAPPSDVTEPEVVVTTPENTGRTVSTAGATDYIVEDGDSFWKIAQEQLGDGTRYKEILELNPDYSENQTLPVGIRIKIPAR